MSDANKAVFLSYASQDAEAAKRICDSLRAAGVEVWFDAEGGLEHGDEWDAKIRRQIKECVLFIAVISANTQAREEGYFRIEWELAAERTMGIASGVAFILPVIIDGTPEPAALVPDRFRKVQWTRLPDGMVPPEVLQRFLKLWSHRTGLLKHDAMAGNVGVSLDDTRGRAQSAPLQRSHRWLVLVVLAAGLAAAVALWQPWKQDHAATADAAKPAARAVAPRPATPADKLVERANVILNGSALSREQIDAANGLLEQAMVLEPTNGAAWTAAARADLLLIHPYRYDRSAERRQRAMSRATRALNLAPDSLDTRIVQTAVMAHASDNPALTKEAEETFRRMIQERPDDQSLQVQLGEVLREQERFEDAAALFEQVGDFELAGWSWFQAGRFAAAYAPVKRAVVEHRTTTALALKALIEINWLQDLGLAQTTMDQLRPSELQVGSGAVSAAELAFSRRDPERILQLLSALPRDFIETPAFIGPRQYFTGWAHRIAGRTERAKIEWRKAVALIQTELASAPDRVQLIVLEAEILALLGETAEAERMLATAQGIANEAPGTVGRGNIRVYLALGRKEPALSWLGSYLRARSDRSWPEVHAAARFSPVWDGLRGDPRFEALLRETKPEDAVPFDNPPPAVGLVAPDAKSVAVLAFANLSDDKANEYFSDGISEELLNVLAKIPGLKVSARTSAFYFKGKEVPIPEIAQKLGVAYVVEGSVRKAGDKVRINAQLIKAVDGFHVWSDTFTRDLKDIFAVQDEIAGLIAKNLELKLGGEVQAARVIDPEAFRLLLLGRAQMRVAGYVNRDAAIADFRQAVALAPNYAEAWAELALALIRKVRSGATPVMADQEEAYREARTAVNAAHGLKPDSPEVLLALGLVRRTADWDWRGAAQALRRALSLYPDHADVVAGAGLLFANLGHSEQSLRLGRHAVELDPLNPEAHYNLGLIMWAFDRSDEWVAVQRRALSLAPQAEQYQQWLAIALADTGHLAEAEKEAARETDTASRHWAQAYVLLRQGRKADALTLAQGLNGSANHNEDFAELCAVAGERDQAFAALELGAAAREGPMSWVKVSPYLLSLHDDPRWPVLLHKMGLADDQLK